MTWLRHDSGGPATLKNQQVLGADSPLEFDEDGYAEVDDEELADKLLAMHTHVERGVPPDDDADGADADSQADADADFDAAAFVDRTPMEDVVDDIETGEADGHLNAVVEEASRNGVLEAIEARREE